MRQEQKTRNRPEDTGSAASEVDVCPHLTLHLATFKLPDKTRDCAFLDVINIVVTLTVIESSYGADGEESSSKRDEETHWRSSVVSSCREAAKCLGCSLYQKVRRCDWRM
jgi:hypothetical protein